MKEAIVMIQIIKVYQITVDVPKDATRLDAETAAYELQSDQIETEGKLKSSETDFAEFRSWVD